MNSIRRLAGSLDERTRNLLWFLFATAILAGLIYLVDYQEFFTVLVRADTTDVAAAIACGCFTLLMWAVVWHRFFAMLDIPVSFRESLRLLLAGTFLNAITPLGRFGGEPFMAHLVARRTDATFQQALSSVSSADLSNAVPFVTLGVAALSYVAIRGTLGQALEDIAWLLVVLAALSVLIVYLLWFGGAQAIIDRLDADGRFDHDFGRWEPHVDAAAQRVQELLDRMEQVGNHPREVLLTIGVSHAAVAGHVGAVYFVLLAVDVEPVVQSILLVVTLSTFLTFSPTPGSTGTFEAGFAGLIVAFFPVNAATATTIAVLYRIGTYLPGLALGYGSLVSLNRPTLP